MPFQTNAATSSKYNSDIVPKGRVKRFLLVSRPRNLHFEAQPVRRGRQRSELQKSVFEVFEMTMHKLRLVELTEEE